MSEPTLHLTNLGHIAYQFGACTGPEFWRQQWRDINEMADQDGDWLFALQERIDGLTAFRDMARDHGLDWFERARPDCRPAKEDGQ